MFDNKDFSFGRSGTAPTRDKVKAPTHTRPRPKTRTGISNDGGASDLADLNLALKMDNQLNIMEDDDDAFENYQSAIDSWETGLKSRHAPQSASSSRKSNPKSASSPHSSKSNSATYKSSDPVSAAYFSQFRPNSRSTPSSSASSPRSRLKTSNRTDEIRAVYGVSSGREAQSGTASGHRRKPPRPSEAAANSRTSSLRSKPVDSHSTQSPASNRPPSAATSSESRPPSGSGRGTYRERDNHRERAGGNSPPSRPSSSSVKSSSAAASFQQPGSYSQQPPLQHSSTNSNHPPKSMNDAPPAKGAPFKRHHQKILSASAAMEKIMPDTVGHSTVQPPPSSPSVSKGDNSKSDRPESRKLYLGVGGGGGGGVLGGFQQDDRPGGSSNSKVPRSAGAKTGSSVSSSGASSSGGVQFLSTAPPPDHSSSKSDVVLRAGDPGGGEDQSLQLDPTALARTSSFSGFSRTPASPAPWHSGDNINLDDRPPSRQRSAFPTHLGREELVVNPPVSSKRRSSAKGGSSRNTDAFSSDAPPAKESMQAQTGTGTLNRPPSRQRLNAQHLWSDKPEGGGVSEQERAKTPDYSSDDEYDDDEDYPITLTAAQSAASAMTGGLLFDEMDYVTASPPPVDKAPGHILHPNACSNDTRSTTPSPQLPLGPMYDPLADGFTQLESRGSTAPPFKIRYNPPSSNNIANNGKKPSSAVAKNTKYRMLNKSNDRDRDTLDFNDCEVVEDSSDLHHTSGKPPSDQSSCRSSPSPEQHFESYSAWRSNTSSPTSRSSSPRHQQSRSMSIPRSKSALSVAANLGKDVERGKDSPLAKSASATSLSPTSQIRKQMTVDAARNRAFMHEFSSSSSSNGGDMVLASPGGSPRLRHRPPLASNLDDMSFADEELTEMSHCSDENENGNGDINRFGGELSQSIMLESSLGQDFLNLFAPCD